MKKFLVRTAAIFFLALVITPGVYAAPFTFTFSLLPTTGEISGTAGELVGWGYKITNEDADHWFLPTTLSASSFTLGTPDASFFDFPVLAPSGTISKTFLAASGEGLYGIEINASALSGQSESGKFTLLGEWWSNDPLGGGTFLQDAAASEVSFNLRVTSGGIVPTPATLPLILTGVMLLMSSQRCFQKRG